MHELSNLVADMEFLNLLQDGNVTVSTASSGEYEEAHGGKSITQEDGGGTGVGEVSPQGAPLARIAPLEYIGLYHLSVSHKV